MLVSLLLTALVAGCEPCPHYNRVRLAAFTGPEKVKAAQRKPYGSVRPFPTVEEIQKPFEIIGFMSCEASSAEEGAILKAMLYRAADMGADGLLLGGPKVGIESITTPPGTTHTDVRFGWMTLIGTDRYVFRGQAVRFKN
jgi:hypothetical protein